MVVAVIPGRPRSPCDGLETAWDGPGRGLAMFAKRRQPNGFRFRPAIWMSSHPGAADPHTVSRADPGVRKGRQGDRVRLALAHPGGGLAGLPGSVVMAGCLPQPRTDLMPPSSRSLRTPPGRKSTSWPQPAATPPACWHATAISARRPQLPPVPARTVRHSAIILKPCLPRGDLVELGPVAADLAPGQTVCHGTDHSRASG